MKKLLLFAAVLMMASSASAQKNEDDKTVYIVDGKVVTEQEFKAIPEGAIKDMNIKKGVKSVVYASTKDKPEEMIITRFRKEGKERILHMKSSESGTKSTMDAKIDNGKIVVTPQLQSADEVSTVVTTVSAKEAENVKISLTNEKEDENRNSLILIVDSKGYQRVIKREEFRELKAPDIESILVCRKEDEAVKKYGKQYGDLEGGIIVVTLRRPDVNNTDATQKELKMITVRGDGKIAEEYAPSGSLFLGYGNPTILVTDADGKTAKTERVEDTKIDDIESFDVIKDEKRRKEYEKKYGPSKDGYIHIELKKKK